MQNQNPYKPTPAANDLPGAPRLPRYRLSAFVMALFALPMLLYLPATIRYVLQSGDLRNTWMGLVFFLYLLSTAGLAVFVEVQGGARGMSFLPIALVPHIVLSLFILPNFFNTISSAYFSLSWIIQNPPVRLDGPLVRLCGIIQFSVQCAGARFANKSAANHAMHTKHRMTILQMETTLAVLGDRRRSLDEIISN